MASVFLSYDREDAGKARPIAAALEKAGHSVWWDRHIKGGSQYGKEIEEALNRADAVVVLWSERSVESAWVRDEAAAGRDRGCLVPVQLDHSKPPMGFRQFQTIDMARWKSRGRIPHLPEILAAIDGLGNEVPEAQLEQRLTARLTRTAQFRPIALGLGMVLALALGLFLWQPWDRGRSAPVVGVVAADESSTTGALSRDLLVQLGSLQASNANALELVGTGSEHEPDLIFQVSGSTEGGKPGANLALLQGRKRILLWSRTFQQPAGREADLRQQLAYSAAQVLRCAAEAMKTGGQRLRPKTRKLYLNGCAEFAEHIGTEATAAVVPTFVRVVEDAPTFRDGWAKLLLAESALVGIPGLGQSDIANRSLRRHIARARTVQPDMPEIFVAQAALLPFEAHAERLRLFDRAKQLGPDNSLVLVFRALELANVGRMNDAITDLSRAVQLEPLLPSVRDAYISTLGYSGRTAMAEQALSEAERLWPGTSSIRDASFRYHFRYGNPSKALALLRSGIEGAGPVHDSHEAFLKARVDPSPQNIDRAVQSARAIVARYDDFGFLIQVLGEFAREEELHDLLERWSARLDPQVGHVMFRPALKKFREDPRFMRVAERLGLVEYWRASGQWPDFCFEPDLPYDCKEEAAKLAA